MKLLHIIPLWILLVGGVGLAQAQDTREENCDVQLEKAQKYFEQGYLELIPQLLAYCRDFSSEAKKEECFALLSRTYYYLNEHWKADATYLELLKLNPQFLPQNEDFHPEYVQYLDKFYFRKRNFYATAGYNVFSLKIVRGYDSPNGVRIKNEEIAEYGRGSADIGFAFNIFKSHILLMPGVGVDEVLYKFYGTYDNGFLSGEQGLRRSFGTSGQYYLGRAYLFIQFDQFPFFKYPDRDLPTVLKGFYLGGQYYYAQPNQDVINDAMRASITSPEELMETYFTHQTEENFARETQFFAGTLGYRLKVPFKKKKAWSLNIDGRADLQFNTLIDENERYQQGTVTQDVFGLTNDVQPVFRLGIGLRHERIVPKTKKLN